MLCHHVSKVGPHLHVKILFELHLETKERKKRYMVLVNNPRI